MVKGTWIVFDTPSKADMEKVRADAMNSLGTSDRGKADSALLTIKNFAAPGAALGLGVGILHAIRHRRLNLKIANAFKPAEQPVSVKFANGRQEQMPSISGNLKPSKIDAVLDSLFYASGGLLGGALIGWAIGAGFADLRLAEDRESRARIIAAFQRYRIGVLRKRAETLEASISDSDSTRT